ncbi:hypothetical protein ZWY2020_010069 [Hordeum vulgare]|nr:hypothetical protein ZWY2020_010069 [Hordeum vulgare]
MEVLHFIWHWWNNRHKNRNGEQVKSGKVISHDAWVSTTEYMELWPKKEKGRNTKEKKWQSPRQENLQFNIDASFIPETNIAAWGVIFWGHAGTVVACKAGRTFNASDAYAAELWAMTHAFDLASELGASRVEMESDTELLFNAMNNLCMDSLSMRWCWMT